MSIDENKLLSYLNDIALAEAPMHDGESRERYDVIMNIMEIIENQPKVGEWILCEERLPEDRRPVLVTAYWHETYQVMMGSYYGDDLWWCVPFNNTGKHEQKLNPIAWRTLPEPYREDGGSSE